MTLAEIYDAIMSVDASLKRIESNQIDEFERVKARVRAIEDGVEEVRVAHKNADDDCREQITQLRRSYHDMRNKMVPIYARLDELEKRDRSP